MEIILTSTGKRDLDSLQEDVKKQIYTGLDKINLPVANIKKIKGKPGLKRLRLGDYRVLFKQEGNKVYVMNVKHRKDVYR
jgi:mRNA interferase RelE/StbE